LVECVTVNDEVLGSTPSLSVIIYIYSMQVYLSDRPTKRFVALYQGKKFYFGSPSGYTYVDGASELQRENYVARHMANEVERYRIQNRIMSPALLSMMILWNTPDMRTNIKTLNKML